MPDPNDQFAPFEYVQNADNDDVTWGTASATSGGTPSGRVKWGSTRPGVELHDPAQSVNEDAPTVPNIPEETNPWDDWTWDWQTPGGYYDPYGGPNPQSQQIWAQNNMLGSEVGGTLESQWATQTATMTTAAPGSGDTRGSS